MSLKETPGNFSRAFFIVDLAVSRVKATGWNHVEKSGKPPSPPVKNAGPGRPSAPNSYLRGDDEGALREGMEQEVFVVADIVDAEVE